MNIYNAPFWPTFLEDNKSNSRNSMMTDPFSAGYLFLSSLLPRSIFSSLAVIDKSHATLDLFWTKLNKPSKFQTKGELIRELHYPEFEILMDMTRLWLNKDIGQPVNRSILFFDDETNLCVISFRRCLIVCRFAVNRTHVIKNWRVISDEIEKVKDYINFRIYPNQYLPKDIFSIRYFENTVLFWRYFMPIYLSCVNPRKENIDKQDCFFWPWQFCLPIGDDDNTPHNQIRTSTLVLDIRNSTIAYNLSEDSTKFMRWMDQIKSEAKEIGRSFGGVFSVDTGDGVVINFCDEISRKMPANGRLCGRASVDSLLAADRIIERVSDLSDVYAESLDHGMDKLGPSIGIHLDDAVWICSGSGYFAIGKNVIDATRLCSMADRNCILMSQKHKRDVDKCKMDIAIPSFRKKSVNIKELGDKPGIYAYEVTRRMDL